MIIGATILSLTGICFIKCEQLKKTKAERDIYQNNTKVLIKDIEFYKTKDSLNVLSVENLEIKLSEYRQYREDDFRLIESLKVDNKRLERITTSQIETKYEFNTIVKDSTVYRDRIDTLRCISINEKWFDLTGCIDNNNFSGNFTNRDSLLYVEHIVPKKFWFVKWGIKERKQDIVSKNPYTQITGAEFVTIRKSKN